MLLLTAIAMASSTGFKPETVDTDYGEMPTRTVHHLCEAEHVVIGTVTHVDKPYWRTYTPSKFSHQEILTDVTVKVEMTLHGDPNEEEVFGVPGGSVDGAFVRFEPPTRLVNPVPETGRRFLLAYNHAPKGWVSHDQGEPVALAAIELPGGDTKFAENDILEEAARLRKVHCE